MAEGTEQQNAGEKDLFIEVGERGLKRSNGWVNEEFLPQLRTSAQKNKVYTEMRDNDPIIGSFLFIIEMLIRNVEWRVQPCGASSDDKVAAEFIESCLYDMETTFEDVISEILSMLPYGWAIMEKVFKVRKGSDKNPQYNSKYTDGLIGWRKLPLRAQDSLENWVFDDAGDAISMIQRRPVDYTLVEIPLSKTLHFRTSIFKNNPEGRSILRNAYKPYYYKKNIESIQGIGIERDLAGLPVMYIPADTIINNPTTYEKYKNIVRNVRRDEMEGIILPSDRDTAGNKMYEFELLSSGGSRQFNTTEILDQYDKRIASVVAADFILLGQSNVGSFALSSDKTNMFANAIGGWLNSISAIFNRHGIDQLLKLNNMKGQCELTHGDIEKDDIEKLARVVETMARAGAPVGNKQFNSIFEIAGIPIMDEEDEMAGTFTPDTEGEETPSPDVTPDTESEQG